MNAQEATFERFKFIKPYFAVVVAKDLKQAKSVYIENVDFTMSEDEVFGYCIDEFIMNGVVVNESVNTDNFDFRDACYKAIDDKKPTLIMIDGSLI